MPLRKSRRSTKRVSRSTKRVSRSTKRVSRSTKRVSRRSVGKSSRRVKSKSVCINKYVVARLDSDVNTISGASLTKSMISHISKLMRSDYKYAGSYNGSTRVSVKHLGAGNFSVSLCNSSFDQPKKYIEFSVDDDGNYPYVHNGVRYLVVVRKN